MGNDRTDVYQEVTDRVLAELENGTVPWAKPWRGGGAPRSMSTGKRYRGINVMLLGMSKHYSPWWGTYRQIAELGGQVRRGERSTAVTFWKELQREDLDRETGEASTRRIPMLRQFRVFSADQAGGLPARFYPEPGAADPITAPQTVLDAYLGSGDAAAMVHDAHGEAYYSPDTDTVHIPPIGEHRAADLFYSVAFHELAHSTGHESRLNRFEPGAFGSHNYGKEELAAQWSAALLNAETGIDAGTEEQSAAYLRSWAAAIKADKKLIISAAAAGQRAADMILEPSAQAAAVPDLELEAA